MPVSRLSLASLSLGWVLIAGPHVYHSQAEYQYYDQAASDPSLAEESIGLLGDDAIRGTGQPALRLG